MGARGRLPRRAPYELRATVSPPGLRVSCGSFMQGRRSDSGRLQGFWSEDGGAARERRHNPCTPDTGVSTLSFLWTDSGRAVFIFMHWTRHAHTGVLGLTLTLPPPRVTPGSGTES